VSIGAIALLVTVVTTAAFTLFGIVYTSRRTLNLEDYMVSRNQMGSGMALATIVASALGAWILFSPPEAGSAFGGLSAILGYCVGSAVAVALFCAVGPRLRHLMPQGHSLNEYVQYRFGGAMYWLSEAVMVLYMWVYLTAELTAIAKALQLVANVPLWATSLIVITAVFIYTTYGGLWATILTDAMQFAIIVPLLLVCFGATVWALGGFSAAFAQIGTDHPEILSLNNRDGLRFGMTLILAIVSAEFFNQGNWQRVYAARSSQVVRRAFLSSALLILPMLLIAGLLGLMAVPFGLQGDTAFFALLNQLKVPNGVLITVIVLALALVMSSLDTLLNGIASVFTLDLLKRSPNADANAVLKQSRWLTVVAGLPAVVVASQGYSVLYLFLVADLICAAVIFPVLWGLYSRHLSSQTAFISAIAGILAGTLFFPKPDFTPWLPIPGAADLLNSFAAALVVSTLVALSLTTLQKRLGRSQLFNYEQLKLQSRSYVS
jgi:Na+/proline symporter